MNRKKLLWLETILQIVLSALCGIKGWSLGVFVTGTGEELVKHSFYDVCGDEVSRIILCAVAVIFLSWKMSDHLLFLTFRVNMSFFIPLAFQAFVFGNIVHYYVPELIDLGYMLPLGYIHIVIMAACLITGILLLFAKENPRS